MYRRSGVDANAFHLGRGVMLGAALGGPHVDIFVVNEGIVVVIQRDGGVLVVVVQVDVAFGFVVVDVVFGIVVVGRRLRFG